MSHKHINDVNKMNSVSNLDRDQANPVVMYSIGHTIPNTQPGGLRETLAPDDFRLGHSKLVIEIRRPKINSLILYVTTI